MFSEEDARARRKQRQRKQGALLYLELETYFVFVSIVLLKLGIGSHTPEGGEIQICGGLQSKSNLEGGKSDVHVFGV